MSGNKANNSQERKTSEVLQSHCGISLEAGTFFGRYRVIEKIGHGATAQVYKAFDLQLDRNVALKIFTLEEKKKNFQRFLREAKSTARLQHPNIVVAYDIGVVRGQPYFTMEYIDGLSLQDYIYSQNLTISQTVEIVKTIGEAIQYAHDIGIIHRDLKPSNVMMDKKNKPRLMDFGLAKIVREADKLSKSGTILGTPHYMPPEQAQGKIRSIDERSDVYSLGAILYEMLTKRPPHTGSSSMEIIYSVVHHDPILPSKLNSRVSKDLEKICMKALAKHRKYRYPSVRAFMADLQDFTDGKAIKSNAYIVFGRAFRTVQNHKIASIIAIIAVFAIIVFGSIEQWKSHMIAQQWLRDLKLAEEHYTKGNFDSSFTLYTALLRKRPDDDELFARLTKSVEKWIDSEDSKGRSVIVERLRDICKDIPLSHPKRRKILEIAETVVLQKKQTLTSETNNNTNTNPQFPYSLSGNWISYGYLAVENQKIEISQSGNIIQAKKITGDEFVPAGEITWSGILDSNPFFGKIRLAQRGFKNPSWSPVRVNIIDQNLIIIYENDLVKLVCLRRENITYNYNINRLQGIWDSYGYQSSYLEKIKIDISGNDVKAYKLVGNNNVSAGGLTWQATIDKNPFYGQVIGVQTTRAGRRRVWIQMKVLAIDDNLLLIYLADRSGQYSDLSLVLRK